MYEHIMLLFFFRTNRDIHDRPEQNGGRSKSARVNHGIAYSSKSGTTGFSLGFHDRFLPMGLPVPINSSERRFSSVGVGFHLRGLPAEDLRGLALACSALTKSSTLPASPSTCERRALKASISSWLQTMMVV